MNSNINEKTKLKKKISPKKINNNINYSNNNNPFNQIQYFCYKEVKKITNNKDNKSFKTIEKTNKNNKILNNNFQEEDAYSKLIYNKKLIISHNISSICLPKRKFNINQLIKPNDLRIKFYSTDERFNTVNIFGFYTKKIFCEINKRKMFNFNKNLKTNKFSKKNKKKNVIKNIKKFYEKLNINENKNNINSNKISYSNISSNIQTIANNTIRNYTIFNISNISYYKKTININSDVNNLEKKLIKKENNLKGKIQKINNMKILNNNNNKNNNKNKIYKNINKNNKENKVFIRRIILEEKFTIDSEGNKKTIYFKRISPIKKVDKVISSSEKRLNKNRKMFKNDNNYSYRVNNDINYNSNVSSTSKIRLNNITERKNNTKNNDNYKSNKNNIHNENIFSNDRNSLNYNNMIFQKPLANFSPNKNKKYYIRLRGKNLEKKNTFKNSPKNYKPKKYKSPSISYINNKNNINNINNKIKENFSPLNNIKYKDYSKEYNCEEDITITNKRSFSFVNKPSLLSLVNNIKQNQKTNLGIHNESIVSEDKTSGIIPLFNKNKYLFFSQSNSSMTSNNTKKNSINNSKYFKKINLNNKHNIFINIDDNNTKKNYNYFSLNKEKNIYKKKMSPDITNNEKDRNILIKKFEKFNLDLNKIKVKSKKNNKRINYSYLIYKKNNNKKKVVKNK